MENGFPEIKKFHSNLSVFSILRALQEKNIYRICEFIIETLKVFLDIKNQLNLSALKVKQKTSSTKTGM